MENFYCLGEKPLPGGVRAGLAAQLEDKMHILLPSQETSGKRQMQLWSKQPAAMFWVKESDLYADGTVCGRIPLEFVLFVGSSGLSTGN